MTPEKNETIEKRVERLEARLEEIYKEINSKLVAVAAELEILESEETTADPVVTPRSQGWTIQAGSEPQP